MSPTQHPVLVQILSRFVLNLKPQTRNLRLASFHSSLPHSCPLIEHAVVSPDQLASTISAVLQEHFKSPTERTTFWDDERDTNVDPLQGVQGGIWGADWDLKVRAC